MPDETSNITTPITDTTPAPELVEPPAEPPVTDEEAPVSVKKNVLGDVIRRIDSAESVLIALPKSAKIDELSAAIALATLLDQTGKHVTVIYSGAIPEAIEFLNPKSIFETNANSLQDFIIALDKEKADHLRYKVEDDEVRIYITPYRTTLSEGDLSFSHGDFNVDMMIAMNVQSADDLDSALSDYKHIIGKGTEINLSAGTPGKLAETEWSEPEMSSVSEMIVKLVKAAEGKLGEINATVATALLTGIVSATERFSNERTKSETMTVAAKLMEAGADQQAVMSNITKVGVIPAPVAPKIPNDGSVGNLMIEHTEETPAEMPSPLEPTPPASEPVTVPDLESAIVAPESSPEPVTEEPASALTEETVPEPAEEPATSATDALQETMNSIINNATTTEESTTPDTASFNIPTPEPTSSDQTAPVTAEPTSGDPTAPVTAEPTPEEQLEQLIQPVVPMSNGGINIEPDKDFVPPEPTVEVKSVVAPEPTQVEWTPDAPKDYGRMMEEELANPTAPPTLNPPQPNIGGNPAAMAAPIVSDTPEVEASNVIEPSSVATTPVTGPVVPEAPTTPEVEPLPMPTEDILPPPPAPPVSGVTPPEPAATPTPPTPEENPATVQPAPTTTTGIDSNSFQIPGM